MKKSDPAAFIPFALPDIGSEEIAEVVECLQSGWITSGPKTRQFEEEFAAYVGDSLQAIAVNSATAGLHLAVEAAGLSRGDEVITTTHTFTATAEVVRYFDADPVFVDIDLLTYCIDPSRVSERITAKTRLLMPVHYGGHSCDMDAIFDIADEARVGVVEDAAHALPTTYKSQRIGTLRSLASVFSFYATKTIATGEGGMLVTRDAGIAQRARTMRLHGIDRDAFDRYRSSKPAWYYEVIAPGYKYNMTDIAAAIGIQQLRKANDFHVRRSSIARIYDEELKDLPLILPPRPLRHQDHAWHLYVVRIADEARVSRDEVIASLFRRGVGCSVHYVPLHRHPYWRDRYSLDAAQFPNSEKLYEKGLSLPIYTKMSEADQLRVIDALKACFRTA